jgi:hypothetical protein
LPLFHDADARFQVEQHLLRNRETIRTLANIGLKEPSRISFFDRRIISMGKA